MTAHELTVHSLSKAFGATQALADVGFTVTSGRVHALVGENGAGKSTLLKIVSGVYRADSGTVQLDGTELEPGSLVAAQRAGIQIVHQELALMPDLTVTENIYAGQLIRRHGLLDRKAMEKGARTALARLGCTINPVQRVDGLTTAEQQFIELARGLVRSSRIFILDEPTAALPPVDAKRLLKVLRELADAGTGIAYVSHRLDEVLSIADEVTVLKDGRVVTSRPALGLRSETLISLMVGRPMETLFPPRQQPAKSPEMLSVRGLISLPAVRGVDLDVRPGEVVGLYGLEGAGQDQVLATLAGDLQRTSGDVQLRGRQIRGGDIPAAAAAGIGFLPPDRKHEGLVLDASGIRNISLPVLRTQFGRGLFINEKEEILRCTAAAATAGVRGDVTRDVKNLSGGNQQKVLLARLLQAGASLLLLNQPTRGVDVGAKAEIYHLIRAACENGRAAVVASPEIIELIGLCDRIVVMRDGVVTGQVQASEATEESVLGLAVAA